MSLAKTLMENPKTYGGLGMAALEAADDFRHGRFDPVKTGTSFLTGAFLGALARKVHQLTPSKRKRLQPDLLRC
jgi:hypothetical protein